MNYCDDCRTRAVCFKECICQNRLKGKTEVKATEVLDQEVTEPEVESEAQPVRRSRPKKANAGE